MMESEVTKHCKFVPRVVHGWTWTGVGIHKGTTWGVMKCEEEKKRWKRLQITKLIKTRYIKRIRKQNIYTPKIYPTPPIIQLIITTNRCDCWCWGMLSLFFLVLMFLMYADVGFGDHQVTASDLFSFSPCVRRNRGYIILMPGFVFPNDRSCQSWRLWTFLRSQTQQYQTQLYQSACVLEEVNTLCSIIGQ